MNTREFDNYYLERDGTLSQVFPALMRKVYLWMTLALTITGMTAYGVATSPNIQVLIFQNTAIFWGLMIGELALVMIVSAGINRLSLTTATLLFALYSVLNGVTMSSIFLVYTAASIAKVFFITAATFAAMAFYGYTTKRDLSRMGALLFMATVVNIFLKSSGLDLILSYGGVLIFVGLTAWDSQKIKKMLSTQYDMSEGAQKLALLGALSLYLDFINLFLYLLRILGNRNN